MFLVAHAEPVSELCQQSAICSGVHLASLSGICVGSILDVMQLSYTPFFSFVKLVRR